MLSRGGISLMHAVNTTFSKSQIIMRRTAVGLLFVSLCVSAFLLSETLLNRPIPGCGEGADCQQVLASKWAYIAGLPVSLTGILLYGSLMILIFLARSRSGRWLCRFEVAGSMLILMGAFWFYWVQMMILHAFCPWCCSIHAMASIAAVILLLSRWGGVRGKSGFHHILSVLRAEVIIPLFLVVAFAFYQSSGSDPENVVGTDLLEGAGVEAQGDLISVYDGQFTFDSTTFPMMGSPDSNRMLIVLTDYTCPHCRDLHETLRELVEQQGGDVGIVLLPVFRDPGAQELHRVMLTLWKEDPAYFEVLSSGMLTGEIPANPNKILTLAMSHSAGRFYEKAWTHSSWVEQCFQIGQGILVANDQRLEVSTLPQIMMGETILQGNPSLETLVDLLNSSRVSSELAKEKTPAAPQVSKAEAPKGDAQIKFGNEALILPTVPRGEKATKIFTFTNIGTTPLKILGVKVGCGCLVAEGWKQTVLPGNRGSLQISLDTARLNGKVKKPILITSNATNVSGGVLTLSVKAEVWLPVKLSSYIANYGVILTGETAKPKKITMTLTDEGPFNIGTPVCSNDYFKTSWEETKPGKEYVLTVTIPELHRQREQAEIKIPLGHSKYPEIKIPVHARVADVIEPSPSFLMLSSSPLRAPMTRVITVHCHNHKIKDFKITEYSTTGSEGVELKIKPSRSSYWRQIEVTFPAGFDPVKAVSQKTSILIQTNYPGSKELIIPLRVQIGGGRRGR